MMSNSLRRINFSASAPWFLSTALWLLVCVAPALAAELRIETMERGTITLRLTGATPDDTWTIQDSYDAASWRDLDVIDSGERVWRGPIASSTQRRFFRAVERAPASSQEALALARQKWQETGLQTYMFILESNQFRGFEQTLFSVLDGSAIEGAVLFSEFSPEQKGEPRSPRTIDGLFETIQAAIDQSAYRIVARYHPTSGYPESVYIDYSEQIADEELSFAMSSPPEEPTTVFERNRDRWQHNSPSAYRFHLDYRTAWWSWQGVVRVEDGVASILESETIPTSDHIIQEIKGYFDLAQIAIDGGHQFSIAYDPTLGFPTFISDNWYLTFVDGPGERYCLTDFRALVE